MLKCYIWITKEARDPLQLLPAEREGRGTRIVSAAKRTIRPKGGQGPMGA